MNGRGACIRYIAIVAAALVAVGCTAGAPGTHGKRPLPIAGRCQSTVLRATIGRLTVATGNVIAAGSLRNTGAAACTLSGYPQVTFADAAGRTTGASTATTPRTYAGPQLGRAPAPVQLILAINAHAVFWISWSDMPTGTQTAASCISPVRELVKPSRQSPTIAISQHLHIVACGRLTVEPIEKAGYSPNPNQLTG